jgi:cysteine synthase
MLSEERGVHPPLENSQWELVGNTPFVRLRNSGDGLVSVKLESLNPGGSYFDRVARFQLNRASDAKGVVVTGTTGHTVSVLTLAKAAGLEATVLVRAGDPERLLGLIKKLSADVEHVGCGEECESRKQQLLANGYVFCSRTDADAHRRALAEVALESLESFDGERIDHWIVVDYGRPRHEVARELRRALRYEANVHFIEDDFEKERKLRDNAATRRVQIGHREGLLIGPTSAEVIDKAVSLAFTRGERVCAILPDGGHRYLGWW